MTIEIYIQQQGADNITYDQFIEAGGADYQWKALAYNHEDTYTAWGVGSDYMMTDGSGWGLSQTYESWTDFAEGFGISPDSLNECVNFHFTASNIESDDADRPPVMLTLQLWIIHPRKGASKGVEILSVSETELPDAVNYLRAAAVRNAKRFSMLMEDVR